MLPKISRDLLLDIHEDNGMLEFLTKEFEIFIHRRENKSQRLTNDSEIDMDVEEGEKFLNQKFFVGHNI